MRNHLLESYRPNTFTDALLGVEVAEERRDQLTIVAEEIILGFAGANFDEHDYPLSQVFEPPALWEVCRFAGVDYAAADALQTPETNALSALRWLYEGLAHTTTMQRISLATALVSTSRHRLAREVLNQIDLPRITNRQRFAIAMLSFIVSNRADGGQESSRCFAQMRAAIEAGGVTPHEILDASAHAIVWHLKTGEVSAEQLAWFMKAALEAAQRGVTALARSSWYRAYAMLPAERRDGALTTKIMDRAHEEALAAIAACDNAGARNLLKTYFESSLKEQLYLHRDLDAAKQVGLKLIKLDPAWSASYGELAQVYSRAGDHATAAQLLERALELGPPYRLLHAYQLAHARAHQGDDDGALALLHDILSIDPSNISACIVGLKHARAIGHASEAVFAGGLTALAPTLRPEHYTFLESNRAAFA